MAPIVTALWPIFCRIGVVGLSVPAEIVGLEFYNTYKVLHLDNGDRVTARGVLISTGANYRKLNAAGCDRFEGAGVYYSATAVEAQLCQDQQVVVVGGGNSAGQAAVFMSQHAKRVFLLIRGDDLEAKMSYYLTQRIDQIDNIELLVHTEIQQLQGETELEAVGLINNQTQATQTIETAAVFIFIGAIPCTDWLPKSIARDKKGFILTGLQAADSEFWPLERQPYLLETSQPGVFAAGDVRVDSIKRVASAVGEGSMAVKFAHQVLSSLR